jgi:hypothetical protein
MSKAAEEWARRPYGRVITEEELRRRTHPAWPYLYFNPGQPVEPARVDELLRGAIDVHVHGAPLGGWLPGRPTMVETCLEASEAGMKALVFKDHNTMTNNCAVIIQDFLGKAAESAKREGKAFTPVEVYGGIVLNETIGGMNLKAVRTCLGYGRCKEVWLPSLDARHQRQAMGLEGGIVVAEGNGDVTAELRAILELLGEHNRNVKGDRISLSTCHVSNEEKAAVLRYVKARGLDVDVLLDHVTQEMTILDPSEAKEMIELGGYLEFAECSCIPWPGMQDWIIAFDYSMALIKELAAEKGPDHLLLITDAGQPGNKPVPGWRMFLKTLLSQGVSEADIRVMARDVPAKILYGAS